jgi:hypothetical protein
MTNIKIWADTHSTGLFDELGMFYLKEDTNISDKTWGKLQKWVEDYDDIIVMSDKKRNDKKSIERIKKLDARGLVLKQEISKEWKKDIVTGEKLLFSYYSEGLMCFLGEIN